MLTILQGDVIERLADIASDSIHCVVTSVPYYGLRDYGTATWEGGRSDCDHKKAVAFKPDLSSTLKTSKNANQNHAQEPYRDTCGKCGAQRIDKQIGLEKTPAEYIAKMVAVFAEVRRVLRSDGVCWLNIGDSFAGGNGRWGGDKRLSVKQSTNRGCINTQGRKAPEGCKPKDLLMIPARLAIALCDDGWYLRSEIVWSKPNPMPESVTDRPTRSHEMIYMLTKRPSYFYDTEAVREPYAESTLADPRDNANGARRERNYPGPQSNGGTNLGGTRAGGRNRRSVWTIPTQPTPDAHFATFPEALVEPCILAGTSARGCCAECGAPYKRLLEPTEEYAKLLGRDWSDQEQDDNEGRGHFTLINGGVAAQRPVKRNAPSVCAEYVTKGWEATCKCKADVIPCTVLDPFAGSFTTGKVALRLGRKAIGIELNPAYIEIAHRKCQVTYGLGLAL